MSTRLTIFLYYNDGYVHRQTQMNKHILVYIIICSVIYVETDNRVGYERYIETVYPPLFSMRFD